jgi:hypothetical protein
MLSTKLFAHGGEKWSALIPTAFAFDKVDANNFVFFCQKKADGEKRTQVTPSSIHPLCGKADGLTPSSAWTKSRRVQVTSTHNKL